MLEGIYRSFSKSSAVFVLLFGVYIMWSLLGYVMFQSVVVDNGARFDTFPETLLTMLNCITSRSYSLFALTPYFKTNTSSAAFFVTLIIAGDLICTNLIIAVGNRQFRLFATKVFRRKLLNRRQAIIAAHEILSDSDGFVSKRAWLGFCHYVSGKYKIKDGIAHALFDLEKIALKNKNFGLTCVGFFRLVALLSDRIDIDISKLPLVDIPDGDDIEYAISPMHSVGDRIGSTNLNNISNSSAKRIESSTSNPLHGPSTQPFDSIVGCDSSQIHHDDRIENQFSFENDRKPSQMMGQLYKLGTLIAPDSKQLKSNLLRIDDWFVNITRQIKSIVTYRLVLMNLPRKFGMSDEIISKYLSFIPESLNPFFQFFIFVRFILIS